MAKIRVLPKHIAELIAAGEVVERPASVVKELTENAIDAGATAITIEIRGGGISYIRITDNGCGMEKEDVPNAFLPHATSKLKTAQDLDAVASLGFRGEALSSVAAVARVEVLTRTDGEPTGTAYAIAGGEELQNENAGCPLGTTIVVRDLFYNTPARMKFLKKDVSEANAVAGVVEQLALSHPEISFRFLREDKQALLTPGDGKLLSAIYAVLGREFAQSMLPVEYELDGVCVSGYVCRPISARASRSMQYFFLNGRCIRSRSLCASMENAYKNYVMVGRFPSCVLNVTVPLQTVDVNVHPTKTEVRFSDERKVASCIYYAVSSALEGDLQRKQADLSKLTRKPVPEARQLQMVETAPPKNKDFWQSMPASKLHTALSSVKQENPFEPIADEPDMLSSFRAKKTAQQSEQIAQKSAPQPEQKEEPEQRGVAISDEEPKGDVRLIGEAFKTYILCEYDGKLCLIDKHAAHERILFNRMKAASADQSMQMLLSAVPLNVSKGEYNAILENLDTFSACGFLVEDFGSGSVVVRGCPMLLDPADAGDVVLEIARNLMQFKFDAQANKMDHIFATAACKAAIKAGWKNSPEELLVLAKRVLLQNDVRFCPHGRPIVIEMTRYELEKQFGRIQ